MYIRLFRETSLKDRPAVGGKGASLGELTQAGINIPPGFTITTEAFEQFMASIDSDGAIRRLIAALDPNELTPLAAATAAVREQIEKAPLPREIERAIAAAYAALTSDDAFTNDDTLTTNDPNAPVAEMSSQHQGLSERIHQRPHPRSPTPVAVRSSATSEDSAAASFAGLQDTFLWVRGAESVIRSVRSCWASLYSAESVSYRLRLKLPEQRVSMGVVVQRMVESLCSGVMFTRSPTTGDRSVIAIEGSWGLGSCIVSGEVTPDKFVVSKVTGEISHRTVSEKLTQHTPQHGTSGVRVEEVPADRQSAPCLTDQAIIALAELGKQIERHYGTPQDIEWAIGTEESAGRNVKADLIVSATATNTTMANDPNALRQQRIFILQSRPETVWANREAQPVATPKPRAFDHVFALLSGRDRSP